MLTLTLTSLSSLDPAGPETRRFSGGEIVVGRETGIDWTLRDPDRKLSRRHFVIRLTDGHYWIEDTSTNGVTVNDTTSLELHHPFKLSDGDRIRLSHYQLLVSLGEPESDIMADVTDPFSRLDRPIDVFGLDSLDRWGDDVGAQAALAAQPSLHGGTAAPRTTESDHVSDIQGFFDPPIPTSFEASAAPTLSEPAASPSRDGLDDPDDPFAFLNDFDQPPAAPEPPPPPPLRRDPAPPRRAAKPSPSPAPPPAAPTPAAPDDALRAFLRGAGIDPAALTETDGLAVLTRAGRIMRESIGGLIAILNARNMIKSDLRMDRTMLQPVDNNPLKFSRGTNETLASLLDRQRPGFLEPSAATRAAVQDVLAHEFALVGAMQVALNNLLERFRPENLTKRIESAHPLGGVIPAMRRARYWELYERDYRKIADDMENNFNGVFGEALADAYQKQLAALEAESEAPHRKRELER